MAKIENYINVWFQRLKHTDTKILKRLSEKSYNFTHMNGNLQPYHPCIMGNNKNKLFNSSFEPTVYAGEIINSGLCGKLPTIIHGNKYFCT